MTLEASRHGGSGSTIDARYDRSRRLDTARILRFVKTVLRSPVRLLASRQTVCLLVVLPVIAGQLLAQGTFPPVTLPGTPEMKTLAQVEPRTALPGGSSSLTISNPGSYYLTGNLTVGPYAAAALTISASNVSLDLNGFTIASSSGASTSSSGILIRAGQQNVSIRGGGIAGFSDGVSIEAGDSICLRFEALAIHDCYSNGIHFRGSTPGSQVSGCRISGSSTPFNGVTALGGVRVENCTLDGGPSSAGSQTSGLNLSLTDFAIGNTIANYNTGIIQGKIARNLLSHCTTGTSLSINADGGMTTPAGPFPNDAVARGSGLAAGSVYQGSDGTLHTLQPLLIRKVAPVGDSETENAGGSYVAGYGPGNSVGYYFFAAIGWVSWFRFFTNCSFDLTNNPDGPKMTYGYAGKKGFEIYSLAKTNLLASDADLVTDMTGTNDLVGGPMTDDAISNLVQIRLAFWQACRNAGKEVWVLDIPPYGPFQGGALPLALAANQVRFNQATKLEAVAHGFTFIPLSYLMEQSPGLGADGVYNNDDGYHTAEGPASKFGRTVAATMNGKGSFAIDRKALSTTWLEGGPFASDGGAPPANWGAYAPTGGSVVSQSVYTDSSGTWWRVKMDLGTAAAGSIFDLANFNQPPIGGAPDGKKVDLIAEFRVVEGEMSGPNLRAALKPNYEVPSQTMASQNQKFSSLTADDGIKVISTLPMVLPAGTTSVAAFLDLRPVSGSCTVDVRLAGVRVVP